MNGGSELLLLVTEKRMVKLQLVFLNLNRERENSIKRLSGKRTRLMMLVWMMLIILRRRKMFAGHIVFGYACQVNFSPDGQYVMSGDGEWKGLFWNLKTCKVSLTLKCHEGVCIGVEWHPLEQSKVATFGWDGLIKYWKAMDGAHR